MFNPLDTLLRLMNLPDGMRANVAAVMRTSDGFYQLMDRGDCGYNRFIGKPARLHAGPGLDRTRELWASLTAEQRAAVRRAAANLDGPVRLEEFGILADDSIITV
jgi:hypothetical protein